LFCKDEYWIIIERGWAIFAGSSIYMGQKKLIRFEAIKKFANVLQYPEGMAGRWKDYFGNSNPITLELACGKGEYSVALGRERKDRNYIGVDIKGNRIYIGAKRALAEGMHNVAFLRAQIGQLTDYFGKEEVSEIWIIFPDPFLREGKAKNRLTHPRFLSLYQQVLSPGARIHLKTDSPELYKFTQEVIEEQGCLVHEDVADIYGKGRATGALAIQTHYEGLHLADGRTIYYISFSLPQKDIVVPVKKAKQEVENEHAGD
jgi:tRNA (guanine-N7-)-methyltransferase